MLVQENLTGLGVIEQWGKSSQAKKRRVEGRGKEGRER
jgi:hypothetical protein